MIKRLLALVILFGFLMLLANILVFHYYLEASIFIYIIIALTYIFVLKKK